MLFSINKKYFKLLFIILIKNNYKQFPENFSLIANDNFLVLQEDAILREL